MTIEQLFDRPIAFHRSLVDITGSIYAALFLSQAIYWSKRSSHQGNEFYKTMDEWEDETALTHEQQKTARTRLTGLGVLLERNERLIHRMWYRVDFKVLKKLAELESFPETGNHGFGKPKNTVSLSNIEYIGKEDNNNTENTNIDYRNQIEKDFGGDENEESESSLVNENPENEVRPTPSVPGSLSSSSRPRSGSRWKKKGGREVELFGPLDYSASSREMAEFQEVWNGVFVLQKIVSLKGREPLVREAMKDEWWRNNYREGIKKVAASKFCRGENKLHWKATVEWFLRPTTLVRVLEGQYDGKNPPAQFNPEDFTRETI